MRSKMPNHNQSSDSLKSHVIDYWNRQPCNVNHSSASPGTLQYYSEVETRKYFVEPHIPKFADFENWSGKRVLEIGCGIGTDAINFARNGATYTGIELSGSSLEISKNRFEVFDIKGRLLLGDAENLSKCLNSEEKFDLVYSFGVLHHTPDIELAFREIRKFCHGSTQFKFMVYAENSYKAALIRRGLEQPEAQFGCPIANTYTKQDLNSILLRNGFQTIEMIQDHIFPYSIPEYKKYEYVKLPHFQNMPVELFRALEQELGWHLMVTAKKDEAFIDKSNES